MPKILIVDDDPGVLGFLQRVLNSTGCEIVSASAADAALKAIVDPEIQLVISDVYMPGEPHGIEFIRRLITLRPDCPLVAISGYPNPAFVEECRRLGVRDFLTKPFEMGFVREVVRRWLNSPVPGKGGGDESERA
ncbi:MAG: response regulator [Kiritimatiellae bacterium]|nr:response regulator [Kiritimatiellia bacterium]